MSATAKLTTTAAFIREGHEQACPSWKEKLEAKFPAVFSKKKNYQCIVKIGDRVTGDAVDDLEYMIASVDQKKAALIGLSTGNRWTDPVPVSSISDISREELAAMLGGRSGRADSLIVNGKPYVSKTEYAWADSHKVTVTEAFIKEAHEAANADWQKHLKLQFPTVFAPKTKYAKLIDRKDQFVLTTSLDTFDGIEMVIGRGLAKSPEHADSCIMVNSATIKDIEVIKTGAYWSIAFVKK